MTPTIAPTLTPRDLAAILRVTTRTIERHVRTGKLPPPIKIGNVVRWTAEDVQQLLTHRTTPTAQQPPETV